MNSVKRVDRILAVVDPYAEDSPVIERAVEVAKKLGMGIDLFSCYYEPPLASEFASEFIPYTDNCEVTLRQQLELLHELAEPYASEHVDITIKAAWDAPLYEGVIREVLRSTPRFVMKETHYHSTIARALFSNTDWQLIRQCPVPVWLVKSDGSFVNPAVMAALDPTNDADQDAALDALIMSEAIDISSQLGGTVHAVHAFDVAAEIAAAGNSIVSMKSMNVDDILRRANAAHSAALGDLVGRFSVPKNNIHMKTGKAGELLPYMARELSAKLVVMGAVARGRLARAIIGSTAERVLDHLPCDVLIVKPAGFVSAITLDSVPASYLQVEEENIFKIAA